MSAFECLLEKPVLHHAISHSLSPFSLGLTETDQAEGINCGLNEGQTFSFWNHQVAELQNQLDTYKILYTVGQVLHGAYLFLL